MLRQCTRCKVEKELTEFHKHKTGKGGYKAWCKICCSEENTKYRSRGSKRDLSLRSKHNITEQRYNEMLLLQDGKCATCGDSNPKNKWGVFAVDHDHACCPSPQSCGLCVRGLLCTPCNMALGSIRDNVSVLHNMIEYLTAAPAVVPGSEERKEEAKADRWKDARHKMRVAHKGKIISSETKQRMSTSQIARQLLKAEGA